MNKRPINAQTAAGSRPPRNGGQPTAAKPRQSVPQKGGQPRRNTPPNGAQPRQNVPQKGAQPKPQPPKKTEPKLTPEQIAAIKAERKSRRAAARKLFFARFILFLVTVAVVGLISYGLFIASLTRSSDDGTARYTYVIGDDKYRLDGSKAVRYGKAYVSFSDIAALCDFAVMGSPDNISFIIPSESGDDQVIRFVNGSKVAYINDVEAELGAPAIWEDGEAYVPVDFVKTYVHGINVEHNARTRDISVKRVITNLDDRGRVPKGEEAEYMDMSFLLKPANEIKPLNFEEYEDVVAQPDLGFKYNLSYYEQFMNPGSMTDFLTLVNTAHPLAADYTPQDLVHLTNSRNEESGTYVMLREYAAFSAEALIKELHGAGFKEAIIVKGYSVDVNDTGDSVSDEHLLGLTFHIGFAPEEEDEKEEDADTEAEISEEEELPYTIADVQSWLMENCWKFGFVLRNPAGKEALTGKAFDPSQYRYVGRYHAQKMTENGLCLEEYVETKYPEVLDTPPKTTSLNMNE